jgi:hypothetical protein
VDHVSLCPAIRASRTDRSRSSRSYNLCRFLIASGRATGWPASSQSTKVAICRPKMAGSGPSTGSMRTRKSSNGPSFFTSPFWNSSSGSGRSATSPGTSVEYTTGMPDDTP